jgi:ABC-2 type transport system permease protein
MFALLRKEISVFFTSITGYIVISVFLIVNSLFLWVFPGEMNLLEVGHASLNPLFTISPWVFLFLVPAITMRLFADEKRTGTMELLLTRPLSEMQVVLSKYLASVLLILFSLLPTLVYYFSVHSLGRPPGNLDVGATWGSYLGLFFLGAIYASVGLFASAITDNQIIAFILAAVLCFLLYAGFDSLAGIETLQSTAHFIVKLGINEHYKSISRGVIDSRDLLYYLGVISLFLFITRTVLLSRKW